MTSRAGTYNVGRDHWDSVSGMARARRSPQPPSTPWYQCQAASTTRDAWVRPTWPGQPPFGPWVLPDGRDVAGLLADGHVDALPFPVTWRRFNGGQRWGDLLWTGGLPAKVASLRFLQVLESVGATGYCTFPVTVTDGRSRPVDGYRGLATVPGGDGVRALSGLQNFAFLVGQEVRDAIVDAGLVGVDLTEA